LDYIGVIMPEIIADYDELDNFVKLMNKIRKKASIAAFLLPDDTYDVLTSLISEREHEIDEYSTRKWLTGIIPEPDRFFLSKIHILLHRGDVFKVSEVLSECKGGVYDQINCFKSDKIILLGNVHSAERLNEMNIGHSIRKIKGLKGILFIKLI